MIVDKKRDKKKGMVYKVIWKERYSSGSYMRTWEPLTMLSADGFGDALKIVDRWVCVPEPRPSFQQFCATDPEGIRLMGASLNGTCMFDAFKCASRLLLRPDLVSDAEVDDFLTFARNVASWDVSRGMTWAFFTVYLQRLRDRRSDFQYNTLMKNLFSGGHQGFQGLLRMNLPDGVYLVGAYSSFSVGHCFVLQIEGSQCLVHDKGKVSSLRDEEWINDIAFVRSFVQAFREALR